ncbi:phosphoribosylaminoimidazolesuccinocarboxamide synthase [Candidatus Gottesmanbacteria bacterium]|nr:phosphoribosylaminoimidazolesuccinocarboxamide synthase [Candidatus Gottesmanbacteria bacterium]
MIAQNSKKVLKQTNFTFLGKRIQGKVRDIYFKDGKRILITTDRISAFDRVLGYIPYKGQVLNQLSAFWFNKTKDIVANHLLEVPHPNVSIVKNAKPYPVEMVVRGYITGVTTTAIWYWYEKGERTIYGIKFPEGLKKNQKLKKPVLTPTTKAEKGAHDEKLTHDEIIKKKLVSPAILRQMEKVALALYKRGNDLLNKRGLILVDTKYEFGEYNGKLVLIDEIHTPDSSRFWVDKSYREKFKKGEEPDNYDKEFFRKWYVAQGYRGDGKPPIMSKDLQIKTAQRYISIYEMIIGKKFKPEKYPLEKNIEKVLKNIYEK